MGQDQEQRRHIVARAILAREQVEKFSLEQSSAALALAPAELSWLPKHFFMGDGPGDARDRETKQKKRAELMRQRKTKNRWLHVYVAPASSFVEATTWLSLSRRFRILPCPITGQAVAPDSGSYSG